MKSKYTLFKWQTVAWVIPIILFSPLFAFAGGGQHYPLGVDSFLIGVLPPPGFYFKEYLSYYTATKLKDDSGRTLSLARDGTELDRLSAYASTSRFVWITKQKILGGFYGQQIIVPVARVDMKLDVVTPGGPGELSERRTGVGDVVYSPYILSWHAEDGLLHAATSLDITIPSGPHNRRHLVNIGKNFWTFTPVFGITAFLPRNQNLSAGIKLGYDFNTKSRDFIITPSTANKIGTPALTGLETTLTPGQEFHFDYGIDYAIAKDWRIGIGGYFYQQITDDKTGGGRVKNDKGRVFAIGPGVWYTYKKWIFDLHTDFETGVRNRPQGWMGWFTITHAF